jgi:hypothetical protein
MNKQIDRHTNEQTNIKMDKQTDRKKDGQRKKTGIDGKADKQVNVGKQTEVDKLTDRHTDEQTNMKTDNQTDRRTKKKTDKQVNALTNRQR